MTYRLAFGQELSEVPLARIKRAQRDFSQLLQSTDQWSRGGHVFPGWVQRDERTFDLVVDVDEPAPVIDYSLALSSCLHHARGALSSLAWELSGLTGASKTQRKSVSFPAATSEEDWANVAPNLRAIPSEIVSRIREVQPFHLGRAAARHHTLAVLAKLNNEDKHRTLVSAAPLANIARTTLPVRRAAGEHGTGGLRMTTAAFDLTGRSVPLTVETDIRLVLLPEAGVEVHWEWIVEGVPTDDQHVPLAQMGGLLEDIELMMRMVATGENPDL